MCDLLEGIPKNFYEEIYDICEASEDSNWRKEFVDCYGPKEFDVAKENFIKKMVERYGADEKIIKFISGVLYHSDNELPLDKSVTFVRSMYKNKLSYDFAKMLETHFPGGTVCYNVGWKTFAYVYEEMAYDIWGVSYCPPKRFVAEERLGELLYYYYRDEPWEASGLFMDRLTRDLGNKAEDTKSFVFTLSAYPDADSEFAFGLGRAMAFGDISGEYSAFLNQLKLVQEVCLGKISSGLMTREEYEKEMTDNCISCETSWQLIKRLKASKGGRSYKKCQGSGKAGNVRKQVNHNFGAGNTSIRFGGTKYRVSRLNKTLPNQITPGKNVDDKY